MSLLFAALNQAAQEHRAAVAAQQSIVRPAARVVVAPVRNSWLGLAAVLFMGMVGGAIIVAIMLVQQMSAPPRDLNDARFLSRDNIMDASVPIPPEKAEADTQAVVAEPAPVLDTSDGIVLSYMPEEAVAAETVPHDKLITPRQVQEQLPAPVLEAIAAQIAPYVQRPPAPSQPVRSVQPDDAAKAPEARSSKAEITVERPVVGMPAASGAVVGDDSQALAAYEAVLARQPGNKDALMGKAMILQRMGAGAVALAQWRHLHNKYPQDAAITTAYAGALTQLDGAASRALLLQVLARQPDFAPALSALAALEARAGDLDAAQSNQEQAWALDKDNPAQRLNLAILADKRGDKQQALALYRQALDAYAKIGWKATLPMSMPAVQARIDYLARGAR